MLNTRIRSHLERFSSFTETDDGARLETHCMYPSFEPVCAHIAKFGGEYKIHDGAGAARSAWDHGRDENTIRSVLAQQAAAYDLKVVRNSLVADAADDDWLIPAVLAVVNASAAAAHIAVARSVSSGESNLRERIYAALKDIIQDVRIAKDWKIFGRSGKEYTFDFGVRVHKDNWLLIDSVSPHHVSIAAKYVAFSDTRGGSDQIAARFAVYDRPLEPDDASLIQQVADLMPFMSLPAGVRREMSPT
jgi:hypothetical protein